MADTSRVSSDLIWEISRNQNAYLVKRKISGSTFCFSRDPLNLTNRHSRTHAGFVNEKAVGVQPASNERGVTLMTKRGRKEGHSNHPARNINTTNWGVGSANRKIYRSIANEVAKNGYRPDLRAHAVSRASAIRSSQKPRKDRAERKPRGAKAKKAAANKA